MKIKDKRIQTYRLPTDYVSVVATMLTRGLLNWGNMMKKVSKEPKFKSTDGRVTVLDDWFGVANWCVECGRAIPVKTNVCPFCGYVQRVEPNKLMCLNS